MFNIFKKKQKKISPIEAVFLADEAKELIVEKEENDESVIQALIELKKQGYIKNLTEDEIRNVYTNSELTFKNDVYGKLKILLKNSLLYNNKWDFDCKNSGRLQLKNYNIRIYIYYDSFSLTITKLLNDRKFSVSNLLTERKFSVPLTHEEHKELSNILSKLYDYQEKKELNKIITVVQDLL